MYSFDEVSIPWYEEHFYLINGVKYAYETLDGLDFIWLYDGMGKVYIEDVKAQGYQVTQPKLNRNHVVQQLRHKAPSASNMKKAA